MARIFFLIASFYGWFVVPVFSQIESEHVSKTRLLGSYTAQMMPAGKFELRSVDLLLHTVEAGVTDFMTLGAGVAYNPVFFHSENLIFKSKIGGKLNDRLSVAVVSYWLVPLPSAEDFDFLAPVQALFTLDLDNIQLTAGGGVLFTDDEAAQVIATIGMCWTLGKRWDLITENWWGYDPTDNFYNESTFVVSLAPRYKLKHFSIEAGVLGGFVIGDDGNGGGALPFLGLSLYF